MPIRIAIIAEADADRRHICELIDRKILAHAPAWLDLEQLVTERKYCGLVPGTPFSKWTQLRSLPSPEGALRRGGYIGFEASRHRGYDYPLGRKALLSSVLAKPRVDAVILIRDLDDQPADRRKSLHAARDGVSARALTIVLALPCTKREAWSLNGFDPQTPSEEAALVAVRQDLGFDPRLHPERLNATEHGAKRDAKRVLKALAADQPERETKCWRETSWEVLRQRGGGSGLAEFLAEVKANLVPLVTGQPVAG